MPKKIPLVELIKRAEEVHGKGRYDYSLITEENYKGITTNVNIICNECDTIFSKRMDIHIRQKRGCPNCSRIRVAKRQTFTTEEFIEKAKKVHGDKYDYSKVEYVDINTEVLIGCKTCKDTFSQRPSIHLKGCGCPKCGIEKVREKRSFTTEEFIEKAKKVHGDKYDYSQVIYVNSQTNVIIKCNDCKNTFLQIPNSHLQGSGCPYCSGTRKKSTQEFIRDAKIIHGDEYNYSKVEYINCHTNVLIICNSCYREFKQTPQNHLKGRGCPYCNKSHGEKKIAHLLESKNIKFIPQYRFEDCRDSKPLPFDFYLPNYNVCIEYDGRQHFEEVDVFGGSKQLNIQQKHDSIKNEYCKQNNIPLLRIKYTENIETKLNNFLLDKCKIEPQSIFDLS